MKGQFTIIALISTFMVLVAFIVMYPILAQMINSVVGQMDVYSATLLRLTPFFIVLTIILTIIFISIPTKE